MMSYFTLKKLFKDIKDKSGIRLFTTKNYRPTEFGMIALLGTDS